MDQGQIRFTGGSACGDLGAGPGGSDWSGGLMFDRSGDVVPIEALSFSYFGKAYRLTDRATAIVRGDASATATFIQWRINNQRWRTVRVAANGRWVVRANNIPMGTSRLSLRASDSDGKRTAVKRLTIRRTATPQSSGGVRGGA